MDPAYDSHDTDRFRQDPSALTLPWIQSPFFEELLQAQDLTDEDRVLARSFHEDGYVVLEDCIDPELIDSIVGKYDWLFDPNTEFEAPEWAYALRDEDRTRKQDAWCVCDPVKQLATHPRIMSLLEMLYGRPAIPFQTLNFIRGTEQSLHSDAFHFSSLPARFMCGVWVALEDITLANGPLRYARGSHLLPDVQLADLGLWAESSENGLGRNYEVFEAYVSAMLDKHQLPLETLTCKKGTVLVWSSHLLHGGTPIVDPKTTRLSQVTHYYFDGCLYYTPAHSDTPLGELFLRKVRDVRTGELVPHNLNGRGMRTLRWDADRSRVVATDKKSWEGYLPHGRPFDKLRRSLLRVSRRIERLWGH
ncbi:MAG: hypothetical protein ACI841_004024 [Planctomycetota bacterium]|jgi:hypothetical protein